MAAEDVSHVQVVTGFVPIPGHPRSAAAYAELSARVFGPLAAMGTDIRTFHDTLDDCWLWQHVTGLTPPPSHSIADNPGKNTLAYFCVGHQKFAWLARAAAEDPRPDTFVWIDYGVGHLPNVAPRIIHGFLDQIRPDDFAIPGCWPLDRMVLDERFPCWRFCGGVLVVPRHQVRALDEAVRRVAVEHIRRTNNVWWEVNTLAEAEQLNRLPAFRWYAADHNETMFTNYATALPGAETPRDL